MTHPPGPALVHRLFEAQVEKTPDAPAVIDRAQRLTYRALDERASRLAQSLHAAGVSVGSLVGVGCERSVEMVVALLGILKAGAAYVPLDIDDASARLELVVADAKLAAVVTVPRSSERIRRTGVRCVMLDERSDAPPPVAPVTTTPDDVMHVLYTSGSTGQPKGVVTSHAAVANRLAWGNEAFPFAPHDVACARTSLGFVDSVVEIFAPLVAGCPLFVVDRELQRDVPRLVDALASAQVTRVVVVPSLLRVLLEIHPELGERLPDLRTCFTSGEPISAALVRAFRRAAPRCALVNLYGSTEVAGDATFFDLSSALAREEPADEEPAGEEAPAIGHPIRGVRAFVLDAELREVGELEVGEICIAGACLARGYLNRPELTAARFVRHRLAEGGVLYRTGDLGRRLASGALECLGRIDDQVKIRGMRVELGDVEHALLELREVAHAAVVAPCDSHGGRSLVAFYVAAGGQVESAHLRAAVARRLPEFMVPARFLRVAEIPASASGKVDRSALSLAALAALAACPGAERPSSDAGATATAPRGAIERRVAAVWEDVLERASIDRDESFYELGGDSLAAVRIVTRLREAFGVRLPLDALFAHPTVASLAVEVAAAPEVARLAPGRRDAPSARPRSRSRGDEAHRIPLSYFQFPFWFFSALTGGVSVVSEVFALEGSVDVERLQRAYGATVSSFDALWTRFSRFTPMQSVAQRRRAVRFDVVDARASKEDASRVLALAAEAHAALPFSLGTPPLVHARLVRLPGADDRLLVVIPHVVVDMTSMELFRRTLEDAYERDSAAREVPPSKGHPSLSAVSLAESVARERAREAEGTDVDGAYWQQLGDGPQWNVFPARLFTAKLAGRRARALSSRAIPEALEDRLRRYGSAHHMTLPMTLVGAIHEGIAASSDDGEAALLLMLDMRRHEDTRAYFANFTTLMKLRIQRGEGDTLDVRMQRVAAQLRASYTRTDHQMRRPTQFNDFWASSPRAVRRVVHEASRLLARCWPESRLPPDLVAEYVFALVPCELEGPRRLLRRVLGTLARRGSLGRPGRRERPARARRILVAVNLLPEVLRRAEKAPRVAQPSQESPVSASTLRVRARRDFSMLVRASDLVVNTDALLDTTLQIHLTRNDREGLMVHLYGGGMDQAGLDEVNDNVFRALDRLGASVGVGGVDATATAQSWAGAT